jgi:RNA polymerase sigma-70 factor (ECF subfamily)
MVVYPMDVRMNVEWSGDCGRNRDEGAKYYECAFSDNCGVLLSVTESDGQIVQRVLGGDVEAFAVLVDRHHSRLARYALHILGNRADAEEAVQETFLRAYRALATYEDRDRCDAWLMQILANRCRTMAARHVEHCELDDSVLVWEDADDRTTRLELREEIAYALAQLPADQREAIVLRFSEDKTFEQMSVLTGAGVSALKMRVRRACERLRALLEASRARV